MAKKKDSNIIPVGVGASIGAVSGAVASALTYPLDTWVAASQAKTLDKLKASIKSEGFRKALYSGMSLKTLKNFVGMGAALGTANALNNIYLSKKASANFPNINKDLKVNPKIKHKIQKAEPAEGTSTSTKAQPRWTPINAEARYTWANMDPKEKRFLNSLVSQFGPKVKEHNKNYLINKISKGADIEQLKKKTDRMIKKQTRQDTALF